MKRSVSILSFLLIAIVLSSFILANVEAQEPTTTPSSGEAIPSTDLSQEEQEILNTIKETSDAGTNLITDTSKAIWPEIRETLKAPKEIPGKLYNWTAEKLLYITGATDNEGKNITFFRINFSPVILLLGIIIGIFLGIIIKENDKIKGSIIGGLAGLIVAIFVGFFNWTIFANSYFWEHFAFLGIVWIFFGIFSILAIFRYFHFSRDVFWTFANQYARNQILTQQMFMPNIKKKIYLLLAFSILYILFQLTPILNIALYFITLEFLGTNFFFTWIIRPLIIAFLLFFSKDIINIYSKSKIREIKLQKALEKKAIKEMNKASLGV